jgi:hypothetical protein
MKYGFIVVPAGKEKWLLTGQHENVVTHDSFLIDAKWADGKVRKTREGSGTEPETDATGPQNVTKYEDMGYNIFGPGKTKGKRKRRDASPAEGATSDYEVEEAMPAKTLRRSTRLNKTAAGRTDDTIESPVATKRDQKIFRGGRKVTSIWEYG